jgi:hypothetical protein
MSEYFNFGEQPYNLSLYNFEFCDEKFPLISLPNHSLYWIDFFTQIENHNFEYDDAKKNLITSLAILQYPNISEDNIITIWNHSPSFFSSGYISNNFEYLEGDDRFLRLLRQIKIDRIIL